MNTTPLTIDLLDHAKHHAENDPQASVLHVVNDGDVMTHEFDVDVQDLDAVAQIARALVVTSSVSWFAIQAPCRVDIGGNVAGEGALLTKPGVVVAVIDELGADFWVAEVHDSACVNWHETARGPHCDANGVCS